MTVQEYAGKLRNNISKVIKGKDEVIDLVLMAVLAGGNVLLEDVPGTGKTVLAKAFAKSVNGKFSRIQFTPDLLPSDITGIHFFDMKKQEFVFRAGPIFANILLADEINRATPRTQSALLECMEEKQTTVDGRRYILPKPFTVIATQNPIETQGTYPLPEAQLDRFLIKLSLGYAEKQAEVDVLDNVKAAHPVNDLQPVTDTAELIEMSAAVDGITVNKAVREYITEIGIASRNSSDIKLGLSTRGLIAIKKTAQARAAMRGRNHVTPDDVKYVLPYTATHRIICRSAVMRDSASSKEEIIRRLSEQVPVPTEDIV
ncbi:MAG: MoxR family ATPase [Eubacterium sp.]|nr:MoxR family ATPase [Eubacterium sp.]